jgi:hypothetical protein
MSKTFLDVKADSKEGELFSSGRVFLVQGLPPSRVREGDGVLVRLG